MIVLVRDEKRICLTVHSEVCRAFGGSFPAECIVCVAHDFHVSDD